jgi:hypothetical protein
MSVAAAQDELSILRRVIDPEHGDFPPAAAAAILRLDLSQLDRDRMHVLLEKNRAADITSEEAAELENYCRVRTLLGYYPIKGPALLTVPNPKWMTR